MEGRRERRREREAERRRSDPWIEFADRLASGEVRIAHETLRGRAFSHFSHGDPLTNAWRDLERFSGRPILVINETRSHPAGDVRLTLADAALAVVDDVQNHPVSVIERVLDGMLTPEWRTELVVPHRLLGDPNVVFVDAPRYLGGTPGQLPCSVVEILGTRPGDARLVERWLREHGWPDDPRWRERILGAGPRDTNLVGGGSLPRGHNPRLYGLDPLLRTKRNDPERREALEPPTCPACRASWERFSRRRGGWFFMCSRHADEARDRRERERARRRVRDIERSGDPGWTFDPDEEAPE